MTLQAHGLLFDMDGVLVDSEALMCESAIAALNEWGLSPVEADFTPFIGTGEDRFIGGVAEKHGMPYATAMKDRAYAIYGERAATAGIRIAGAGETLRLLRKAGFQMGVCSGADRIKVDINLRLLGLGGDDLDVVITGSDIRNNKPAPDIYEAGLARLGLPAADCLVIEDSLNGIRAGQAAGIRVIAVASSFTPEALRAATHPAAVISTITELPALLGLPLTG